MSKGTFVCSDCGHVWRVTRGQPSPVCCPECESENIHRSRGHRTKGRDKRRIRKREWTGEQSWDE
ncbi:MAG: hypothetical protein GF400_07230 [Candidatus Eisenbacteria bacterium]|nr:hypothetical protein [Candidatus Eisenbacteria bacterium]